MKELRNFVSELSREAKAKTDTNMTTLRLSLRRAVEAIGAVRGTGFTEVDLTKDECEAVAQIAEFFEECVRDTALSLGRSRGVEVLRLAVRRLRFTCSTAALAIKPNIQTDLRLN